MNNYSSVEKAKSSLINQKIAMLFTAMGKKYFLSFRNRINPRENNGTLIYQQHIIKDGNVMYPCQNGFMEKKSYRSGLILLVRVKVQRIKFVDCHVNYYSIGIYII